MVVISSNRFAFVRAVGAREKESGIEIEREDSLPKYKPISFLKVELLFANITAADYHYVYIKCEQVAIVNRIDGTVMMTDDNKTDCVLLILLPLIGNRSR